MGWKCFEWKQIAIDKPWPFLHDPFSGPNYSEGPVIY